MVARRASASLEICLLGEAGPIGTGSPPSASASLPWRWTGRAGWRAAGAWFARSPRCRPIQGEIPYTRRLPRGPRVTVRSGIGLPDGVRPAPRCIRQARSWGAGCGLAKCPFVPLQLRNGAG